MSERPPAARRKSFLIVAQNEQKTARGLHNIKGQMKRIAKMEEKKPAGKGEWGRGSSTPDSFIYL